MLKLDKLEINGFKSSYDPAQLAFPAAMTAVVCPNGCGKSNICDAIIWVLGENRASHIRGETMDDVIFQGSARRRPLSMGEVTLALATTNGDSDHPMSDDGRITINRRVFRTGESEFRLNGKRVRLKDISDILMDTGLGIRNYSVMEQGKIDLILSNKPQDRRRLIEEAAGITKYKTKRRQAELKLEETQQNLLRIDDTLGEVTRNLNSLKRQAGKARRHKEPSEQLSTAKRSRYKGRIVLAQDEQAAAALAVSEAQTREADLQREQSQHDFELSETRSLHNSRAARASNVREEIAGLTAEVERLRSFLQQSETNLADLLTRIETSESQISSIETEAAEQQALLDEKTQQLDAARAERNRLREVADQLERDRQEKSDAVRQHEKSLADARESLMRTIAKISEARNQVHQIEIAVEKCEFYLSKLSDQARRASENRAGAFATVHDWDGRVTDAQNALDAAVIHARETLALRDELSAHRDALRESLASARDTISQTTYKIGSLRTLLTSLESQDEDVRRAILELIPNAVSAAQSVSATQGFEAALDTLLREVSKAVVVDDGETALEAIRRLRERGAGRGAFINLEYAPAGEGTRRGDAAYSVVGEGDIADAVRHAIPEAYIVGNLREAMEREKEQLIGRKNAALDELSALERHERETQELIRSHEEQLSAARVTFEEITDVASKARVDVETAAGNVNAIAREHENLTRIVVSLGGRATQLQQEIESLARKQQETET